MPFVSDTFTDTDATALPDHVGETGAAWTAHPNNASPPSMQILNNRLRHHSSGSIAFYASGVPATPEYDVEVDVVVFTASGTIYVEVTGRMDTTANTMYYAGYSVPDGQWSLSKIVAGVSTVLGTYVQALTDGVTYAIRLEIRDGAKKLFIDGVERISSADNEITAAGRVGFKGYTETAATATTGIHFDDFTATDPAAPPPAAPTGSIFTRPNPTLDGAAVQVGDGTVAPRNLRFPTGSYATPFWVIPDATNARAQRIDALPAQLVLRCGSIAVSSTAP